MARITGKITLHDDYTLKQMTSFEGHEGEPCVQGDIFKGRKLVGHYSDDTHGGSAWLRWEPEGREEFEALEAYAKSLPAHTFDEPDWHPDWGRPDDYTPLTVPMDLELFISLKIDEHLRTQAVETAINDIAKKIKRDMKTKAVYATIGKSDAWGVINRPYNTAYKEAIHDFLNNKIGEGGYVIANADFEGFMAIVTEGLK